jgi:hypothetical protein
LDCRAATEWRQSISRSTPAGAWREMSFRPQRAALASASSASTQFSKGEQAASRTEPVQSHGFFLNHLVSPWRFWFLFCSYFWCVFHLVLLAWIALCLLERLTSLGGFLIVIWEHS